LVERASAQAKITSLLDAIARGDTTKETRAKVVDLSVQSRVVSPYTALVVLETEQDYQRFGLARRGLADVLAVDGGRGVRRRHVMPKLPPKVAQAQATTATGSMWGDAIGDAFGAGGLGLSGVGEGGGGQSNGNAPTAPWGRQEALREAAEFGMIGLNGGSSAD